MREQPLRSRHLTGADLHDAIIVVYVAPGDINYDCEAYYDYYAHSFGLHWPTMRPPYRRKHYGEKGRILAENRLCRMGATVYYNLLALWIVPQEDAPLALAERWARSISPTFAQYGSPVMVGRSNALSKAARRAHNG